MHNLANMSIKESQRFDGRLTGICDLSGLLLVQ